MAKRRHQWQMKDPPSSSYYLHPLLVISVFYFCFWGEFSQPGDKKKGWRIQQRDF
jgi:hypothetical protein